MKKILLKIIVFISILLLLNVAYLFLIQEFVWDFKKSTKFHSLKNENYQCLVMGNSVALDGIDTAFLTKQGISSFNIALEGANLKTNFIQLNHYLNNNYSPKVILLCLSPGKIFKYKDEEKVHPIVSYNYNLENHNIKNLPFVKFQWLAIEPIKRIISKTHREAQLVRGQLKTKKVVPDLSSYKEHPRKIITKDDYKRANYLFKIDSLCKVNKIEVYTLLMPGYKSTQNEAKHGITEIKFDDYGTIKFVNLNDREFCSLTFTNNDWLGNSHLNLYGGEKLTRYIYDNFLINN